MKDKIFKLNIKEYFQQEKAEIKKYIETANKTLKLAVIQVGDNPASNKYITNKKKDCEEVGIVFEWYHFPEDITTDELIFNIKDLQEHVNALIVQMPVPAHIDVKAVELAIDPKKDVDGFHPMSHFCPCTPLGIVNYLKACDYDFVGKDIAVIGRSDIVGKPMARMLTDLDATVTLCHSKTKDIYKVINQSNLAIVAIGKIAIDGNFIFNTPIVDVGINFDENGKMCGDCYNMEYNEVTPVPGGVGLLTRLAMLHNIIEAAGIF